MADRVSSKFAKVGQSIAHQYDVLNRMLSRTEPEGTTSWAGNEITVMQVRIPHQRDHSFRFIVTAYSVST